MFEPSASAKPLLLAKVRSAWLHAVRHAVQRVVSGRLHPAQGIGHSHQQALVVVSIRQPLPRAIAHRHHLPQEIVIFERCKTIGINRVGEIALIVIEELRQIGGRIQNGFQRAAGAIIVKRHVLERVGHSGVPPQVVITKISPMSQAILGRCQVQLRVDVGNRAAVRKDRAGQAI